MVWSRENVTLVVSMGQTAPTWLGSGTIVGRGCILTARHVVFDDDGQEKPGLAVRVEGSADFVPATVTWPGTNEIDVAVLDAKWLCSWMKSTKPMPRFRMDCSMRWVMVDSMCKGADPSQ